MANAPMNWVAIDTDPRFQALHRGKSRFLWTLMIFSIIYYFLLPVGAAYFTSLFRIKVWGPVNVGILFALSEVSPTCMRGWPAGSSIRWPRRS
jgi:uncharacterized membrane protein (DUF485 family)